MGYRLASVAAITHDSYHSYFVYFIPASTFEHKWVNDWFGVHFEELASRIGPRGVVVAPIAGREKEYRDSVSARREINEQIIDIEDSWRPEGPWDHQHILHSGLPLLAISRDPLDIQSVGEGVVNFAVVNLASFDERQLAQFIDNLLAVVEQGGDPVDAIPQPVANPDAGIGWTIEHALELKPNVFGLGLNLNALVGWLRRRRARLGSK